MTQRIRFGGNDGCSTNAGRGTRVAAPPRGHGADSREALRRRCARPACGRARRRSVAADGGQHAEPSARGFRRGRREGGERARRHAARGRRGRRQHQLEGVRAQQAQRVRRSALGRRHRHREAARARRRRVRRELQAGCARADGARAGRAARVAPVARDRAHFGLGADRPVSAQAGLRHAGRGVRGLRVDQRLRRSRAGAAADVSRRHDGRAVRRDRGGWRCTRAATARAGR
ncbi:L-carnitine dehydratase/bile acid-inducible F domain protein [Burkholderia mallei]|nr:L-carnitine dehydratase/bile acid-inducible F domain protein [Burkholderia mallei]